MMTPEDMFHTPVLFLIFRRPEVTLQVFEQIRKMKPKQLFVCADGPRPQVAGEAERCLKTRSIIDQVDWDCRVFKRYSDVNLGCRKSVAGGINWFFDNVEAGIILEDDCLPSQSFFWFCQELLERYKEDTRVMQISGANFYPKVEHFALKEGSYYFSKFNEISGWATWRRAWKLCDMSMAAYPSFRREKRIYQYMDTREQGDWLLSYLDEAVNVEKCGIWSSQWTFAMALHNGLTACSYLPLSTHIDFGKDATNYNPGYEQKYAKESVMRPKEIEGKIIHPADVNPNKQVDALKFEFIKEADPHGKKLYRFIQQRKKDLKKSLGPALSQKLSRLKHKSGIKI